MFNHIMIGVNDIKQAQQFYDQVLATLGASPGRHHDLGICQRVYYTHRHNVLILTTPINQQKATLSNGFTLAFKAKSIAEVDDFWTTAQKHGGLAIEDPPGIRQAPKMPYRYYMAYIRDPAGHKICASYFIKPEK